MAQLHNALTRGPWSAALKNALGVAKGEGGLERYGETLTPTIDLWDEPEWAFLRQEKLCAVTIASGAVVNEHSGVALVNPADSRVLVTVDKVFGTAAIASEWLFSLATQAQIEATYAGVNVPFVLDRRWPVQNALARARGGSDGGTNVGDLLEVGIYLASTDAESRSIIPCVLPPGQGIVIELNTLNTAMRGNFRFRERGLLPNERA